MTFTATAVRDELRCLVKELVHTSLEPSVKSKLRDLGRHIGMPAARIAKYWYGEVTTPPAHEADQIRAYYDAAQTLIEARKAYDAKRQSFISTYPTLGRFAPRALGEAAVSDEAAVVAESELATSNTKARR